MRQHAVVDQRDAARAAGEEQCGQLLAADPGAGQRLVEDRDRALDALLDHQVELLARDQHVLLDALDPDLRLGLRRQALFRIARVFPELPLGLAVVAGQRLADRDPGRAIVRVDLAPAELVDVPVEEVAADLGLVLVAGGAAGRAGELERVRPGAAQDGGVERPAAQVVDGDQVARGDRDPGRMREVVDRRLGLADEPRAGDTGAARGVDQRVLAPRAPARRVREPDLVRRALVLVPHRHRQHLAQHRRDRLLGVHELVAEQELAVAQLGLGRALEALRARAAARPAARPISSLPSCSRNTCDGRCAPPSKRRTSVCPAVLIAAQVKLVP